MITTKEGNEIDRIFLTANRWAVLQTPNQDSSFSFTLLISSLSIHHRTTQRRDLFRRTSTNEKRRRGNYGGWNLVLLDWQFFILLKSNSVMPTIDMLVQNDVKLHWISLQQRYQYHITSTQVQCETRFSTLSGNRMKPIHIQERNIL